MCSDEKTKVGNANDELGTNPKLTKQLDDVVKVFHTLKELSSNPLQKAIEDKVGELTMCAIQQAFSHPTFQDQLANNPSFQKTIIESCLQLVSREEGKEKGKSSPKNVTHEDDEVSIYEGLSSGDVYIIRKIGDELEVVENHYGEVVYKRIRLSS